VVVEDVLGKHSVITFGEVAEPLEELAVENSIFLKSPRLVFLELPQRVRLWIIQLTLAVTWSYLAP
jgi:hypothetical protein